MKQKIVVSNIRFPYNDWLAVKSAASDMGMSINEYFQYLHNTEIIKQITGTNKIQSKPKGYKALAEFIKFAETHKGKPMGASEEDKAIYGIED